VRPSSIGLIEQGLRRLQQYRRDPWSSFEDEDPGGGPFLGTQRGSLAKRKDGRERSLRPMSKKTWGHGHMEKKMGHRGAPSWCPRKTDKGVENCAGKKQGQYGDQTMPQRERPCHQKMARAKSLRMLNNGSTRVKGRKPRGMFVW